MQTICHIPVIEILKLYSISIVYRIELTLWKPPFGQKSPASLPLPFMILLILLQPSWWISSHIRSSVSLPYTYFSSFCCINQMLHPCKLPTPSTNCLHTQTTPYTFSLLSPAHLTKPLVPLKELIFIHTNWKLLCPLPSSCVWYIH